MGETPPRWENPIFIVGVPRSGTTLMRALLSAHPVLTISPESHFFRVWMGRYRHCNLGDRPQFQVFWDDFSQSSTFESFGLEPSDLRDRILACDPINFKTVFDQLMQSYARKMDKKRWGEKTPAHYCHLPRIFDWYPRAQVLWMLRDPRAVTASSVNQPWASSQADVHARTWLDSLHQYEALWAKDPRLLLVRYETLVEEPAAEMRRVCQFLGEDWDPSLVDCHRRSPAVLGMTPSQLTTHYQSALAPVNGAALDQWRSRLSSYQIAIVEYLTREGMLRYGYIPLTHRPSVVQLGQLSILTQLRNLKLKLRNLRQPPQQLLP